METGTKKDFLKALKSATIVKISCVPKPYCMFITAKKAEFKDIMDSEVKVLRWEFGVGKGPKTLFIYHS